MELSEPSSWAETIKEYEKSRRAPLVLSDVNKRLNRGEIYKKEREYDPILNEFRDREKEEYHKSQLKNEITAATDRYHRLSHDRHNIVTNEGNLPKNRESKIVNPYDRSRTREWNLLSHLPTQSHSHAGLMYNEEFNKSEELRLSVLLAPKIRDSREYSIISNKFNKDNDDRIAKENQDLQEKLIDKYWRTHSFDPIRGKYIDSDQEHEYLDRRKESEKSHGKDQFLRLPPSIRNGDGFGYNIVNNEVKDPERFNMTTSFSERSLQRVVGHKVESQIKSTADLHEHVDQTRKLNRVNYKRWDNQVKRGYNLVTNVEERSVPLPAVKSAPPAWTSLLKDQLDVVASPSIADRHFHEPQISEKSEVRSDVGSKKNVPSLNLALAEPPEQVSYHEPLQGPPGMPVPIVRTGGWGRVN